MPSFQNINTLAGAGDSLKIAFEKVNANFQLITDGEFVVVSQAGVNSVAGRQGDIVLTVNDIAGAASNGTITQRLNDYTASLPATITGIFTDPNNATLYTALQSAADDAIASIVDNAPGALDTLSELAAALNNDADFATTLSNQLVAFQDTVNNNLATFNTQLSGLATTVGELSGGTGEITGDTITANVEFVGTLRGNVIGNVSGNTAGTHTGAVVGNVTGDVTGNVTGNTNGVHTGPVVGNVTGNVVGQVSTLSNHDTGDLAEGSNLYYTTARDDANFTSNLATRTTDNLAEGSNLYYTEARVDANIASKTTDDLTEGANLYYTTARANTDFDTRLATKTTTDLAEGANLYYTDARVGSYLTTNSYATQGFVATSVSDAIDNLVGGAPGALDTLNELSAALGNDADYATTMTNALALKANTADLVTDLSGFTDTGHVYATTVDLTTGLANIPADVSQLNNDAGYITGVSFAEVTAKPTTLAGYGITDAFDGQYTSLTGAPTLATVATSGSYNDLTDTPTFDAGNFTFTNNTLGVSDVDGGITINANGAGEIVMSDSVGINNTNPGAWLEVGNVTSNETGDILVSYGSLDHVGAGLPNEIVGGADFHDLSESAMITWDWNRGNGVDGTTPSVGNGYAHFGIYGGSRSNPWFTIDTRAADRSLHIGPSGVLQQNAGINGPAEDYTTLIGSNVGDPYYMHDKAFGGRFQATYELEGQASLGYQNKFTLGYSGVAQFTPVPNTAYPGVMNSNDRLRGFSFGSEVKMQGQTWWGNEYAPPVIGTSTSINLSGYGNVGASVANATYAKISPVDTGNMLVRDTFDGYDSQRAYIGANFSSIMIDNAAAEGQGQTPASYQIDNAACYIGQFFTTGTSGAGSTVNKVIGLYLPSYGSYNWVRGDATVNNKYSVLSEDPNTVLSHAGNIEIGANGSLVIGATSLNETDLAGLLSGGGSGYSDTDVATYLNGNLNTALIPDTNNTYDLGTAEKKFRDLYLSDSTIYLGTNTISGTSDTLTWNGAGGISSASVNAETVAADTVTTNQGMSISNVMTLPAVDAEPLTPEEGMIARASGAGWDPVGTGVPAIVVFLGGAWRIMAQAGV